jgi:hypothetical protein
MDGSLVSEHLMLFFDVEAAWYSVTIVDGIVQVKREENQPFLTKDFEKEFSYPISNVKILEKYADLKVKSVYVYKISEIEDGILGLYVSYGSFGFTYYNMDDFSYIADGFVDMSPKKPVLVEYKLSLP